MNEFSKASTVKRRKGISLIEVIACIVIVAAMMAPLAGVMRASNRTVMVAETKTVGEELDAAGRWLQNTVQDGVINQVRRGVLSVRTHGVNGQIRVRHQNLVFEDGTSTDILVEGVTRVDFREIRQTGGLRSRIGLRVQMRKRDPDSGRNVTSNTTIALPTQI